MPLLGLFKNLLIYLEQVRMYLVFVDSSFGVDKVIGNTC
jgi:hypothetical protein